MTARRIVAAPLIALSFVILVAAMLASTAAFIYFEYVGIKMIFADGRVIEGLLIATLVAMVAGGVISVINVPGYVLLRVGEWLWGSRDEEPEDEPLTGPWGPYELGEEADPVVRLSGHPVVREPKPEDRAQHTCPECGKTVIGAKGLKQHRKAKHA